MPDGTYNYVYGPVPSRRLGRSLGVDLIPFKTCTYDCIYCQLGRTTTRTLRSEEYVPLDDVLEEIERKAASRPPADYVTLSGSGEPTLYSRLDDLIAGIKMRTSVPVAVITNGSLLWDARVRESLLGADVVLPSLDAGVAALWRSVNRPHPDLEFQAVVGGLEAFRKQFGGTIWLEVLLLGGVTAIVSEVERVAELAARFAPDRVHLNTVVRPAAETFALPVPRRRLAEFAAMFDPPAEVIAEFEREEEPSPSGRTLGDVLNLLRRRPCSLRDVADGLGLRPNEAVKLVDDLRQQGLVSAVSRQSDVFYTAEGRS